MHCALVLRHLFDIFYSKPAKKLFKNLRKTLTIKHLFYTKKFKP